MQNDPTLLSRIFHTNRLHDPLTHRRSVSRNNADVLAVQTERTMVAIAPMCEWRDTSSAMFADKSVVAARKDVFPHTLLCNRVRFVLTRRLIVKGLRIHRRRAITFSSYFIPFWESGLGLSLQPVDRRSNASGGQTIVRATKPERKSVRQASSHCPRPLSLGR